MEKPREKIGGIDPKTHRNVHMFINSNFGKAYRCSNPVCETEDAHSFQWALIHGMEYTRDISHYTPLCQTCHFRYDRELRGLEPNEDSIRVVEAINSIL